MRVFLFFMHRHACKFRGKFLAIFVELKRQLNFNLHSNFASELSHIVKRTYPHVFVYSNPAFAGLHA